MTTWFEDLEVIQFLNLQHPPSIEMEKEWMEKMARDPNAVTWVIDVDRRAIGSTGIREIDWKHGFGTTGTIIGDKGMWGKGLGRELMQLRATYVFTHLPLRKLKSGYLEGNQASERAQKSAGYREIGRWHGDRWSGGKWRDMVLTELLREDWEKTRV